MQWGLKKLNVPKIEYNKKIESSVVAIIDTGIDVNHESLKNSLWENPGEVGIDAKGNKKQNNGIDDDRNGHIDDVHGWNFVNNNNNLKDTNGHGTHIAGIIVGRTPCGMVFGVAPNTKIMVLKYFSSQQSGEQTLNKSIAAMNYAVAMGAQ
ncbi:MAG: S8 family serine peptidase, partial [Bdellovibrionales bacterium]|nr:S8 family serine peptidase [Bdellovibrionales bacterium]